jgi:hypothetical protein
MDGEAFWKICETLVIFGSEQEYIVYALQDVK